MFKSTLSFATIISVILLSFSSCTEDSQADKWVGDEYKGSFIYYPESISEVYEQASISARGDVVSVDFKSSSAKLKGTIDQFDQVEMEDYNMILDDGTVLVLINGSGKFEINTNNHEQVETEVLIIKYQIAGDDDSFCMYSFGRYLPS